MCVNAESAALAKYLLLNSGTTRLSQSQFSILHRISHDLPVMQVTKAQKLLGHSGEAMTRHYVEGKYAKKNKPSR